MGNSTDSGSTPDPPDRVDDQPSRDATGRGLSPQTLEAVRRRDPDALGELFEIYFDRMYSLAYRLLGEHPGAEDVLQEVFLKVHRAASQLDPSRDPGAWLTAVTRNTCREHWRRKRRRGEKDTRSLDNGSGLQETLKVGGDSPEGETLSVEREEALAGALGKLPMDQREVVILHDYEGLDHEEIGRLVSAGGATVRKRYSRALAGLRRHLRGVLK
jgi:RNA polymerase sigma-70 factor (ECF subfamily)